MGPIKIMDMGLQRVDSASMVLLSHGPHNFLIHLTSMAVEHSIPHMPTRGPRFTHAWTWVLSREDAGSPTTDNAWPTCNHEWKFEVVSGPYPTHMNKCIFVRFLG